MRLFLIILLLNISTFGIAQVVEAEQIEEMEVVEESSPPPPPPSAVNENALKHIATTVQPKS